MYYHIRFVTNDDREIRKLDIEDLLCLKADYLVPYLMGRDFEIEGYTLNKNTVSRLNLTSSQETSSECVGVSLSRMPVNADTNPSPEACVFDNKNFSTDITENVLDSLKHIKPLETSSVILELQGQIDVMENQIQNLSLTIDALIEEKIEKKFASYKYFFYLAPVSYSVVLIITILLFGFTPMIEGSVFILSLLGVIFSLAYLYAEGREFSPIKHLEKKNLAIRIGHQKKYGLVNHKSNFNVPILKESQQSEERI